MNQISNSINFSTNALLLQTNLSAETPKNNGPPTTSKASPKMKLPTTDDSAGIDDLESTWADLFENDEVRYPE